MVRLNRIYTKKGDDGSTGLGSNERVSKASLRVRAYGDVDEANAALGLAVCHADRDDLRAVLQGLQHDLFDVGADLCVPVAPGERDRLRVTPVQTARLEALIDRFNADLPPLESFVLPGGTPLAAHLHLARTVVRRAERLAVELLEHERDRTNAEVVRYLNRLSDLLFVLARVANAGADVLWKPGANR